MSQAPPAPTVPSPTRPSLRPHALLLALIIATGCQIDTGSAPNTFEENLWTLSERELRIGSVDDPEYIIGFVGSITVGPDGLLYTLEWTEGSIRRWTPDGQPAGSIGRRGEGPGEFVQPIDLGFFGDSLWVWDIEAYRVSYFGLDGVFLGSVSPRVDFGTIDEIPPRPDRPLRDGTFIGTVPLDGEAIAGGRLKEAPIVRMDADGNRLGTIWAVPFEPHDVFVIVSDGMRSFSDQPFEDGYTSSVGDDGVLVVERRTWTGEGEAGVKVIQIGLDGDTVFISTIPYDPVPLPAERFDSAVAARVEQWRSSPAFADEGKVRDEMYRPAYLPAVHGAMRAADGSIWLRRFDPVQSETGEWMTESWVLDAQGVPLARALVPADLRVMSIDGNTVWGIELDELDVQYIVRYRLVKEG